MFAKEISALPAGLFSAALYSPRLDGASTLRSSVQAVGGLGAELLLAPWSPPAKNRANHWSALKDILRPRRTCPQTLTVLASASALAVSNENLHHTF